MEVYLGKFSDEKIKELTRGEDIITIKKISANSLMKVMDLLGTYKYDSKVTIFINYNDLTDYLNTEPSLEFPEFITMLTRSYYVRYHLI